MRKFLIWISAIFCLALLGATGAYFLAKKFEEPVRNYIISQVNTRLRSPVHVSDINFSFLARFPSASLVMDDVWAEENIVKMGNPDTLFYFKKVYLNLNIFDLINGIYKIQEIEVRDGFLRVFVDADGYDNYHIWKETADTTGFLLELDKVHLEQTGVRFVNEAREQLYDLTAEDLYFKGSFSQDNYVMAVYGDGFVHDLQIKGTSYLQNRTIHLETDLEINSPNDRYTFQKGELIIDDRLSFSISGDWVGENIDLKVQGKELDVIRTLSLIPTDARTSFDDYSSSGIITFDCTLKGAFNRTVNPAIEASFSFINATIEPKDGSWELSGMIGSGTLSNGAKRSFASTSILLDTLSGKFNGDPFELKGSLHDFDHPEIITNVKIATDLQGIQALVAFEGVEFAEGMVDINANIAAKLNDPSKPKPSEFLNSKAFGSIIVSNATLKLKSDVRVYQVDNAVFQLEDNNLEIKAYEGKINDCEVRLAGRAEGFLGYVFTDEGNLVVSGEVVAGKVNLDELFPTSSESSSGVVVGFPDRSRWDLNIITEAFSLDRFNADEISGRLLVTPFKMEATGLHFLSQDGEVNGNIGIYRFDDNQLGIRSDFNMRDVDIKKLFFSFREFDQDFITSEVIAGLVDADIRFQSICDEALNIDTKTILATAEIKVVDGALTGFKPLIDVADEIERKKVMRLFVKTDALREKLKDVRFATLQNEISIRDGIITIPNMQIQSSALDLNVSGTHGFDDQIDYSMDFALADVLTLKNEEDQSEFVGKDKNGKTRIYLRMHGTTENFAIDVERTDLKRQIREEIATEKHTVKGILQQEFGIYKDDSISIQPLREKENPVDFNFDPEAGSENQDKTGANKSNEVKTPLQSKEANPKILDKIIKKTETDKQKLKEGEFDDDDF